MMVRKTKLHQLTALLFIMAVGFVGSTPAEAATTTLNQAVTSGLLTLTNPASATLTPVQTNADADSPSTGSLGALKVMDNRGTYAGWSLTASTSPFSQVKPPAPSRTDAPAVTSSGAYTGFLNGKYTITITSGGSLGTAQYQYSGPSFDGPKTLPADGNVSLGKGVALNFSTGTYQTGDQWTVEVDYMSPSNLYITPAAFTTIDGSPSGVHLGTAYQFSSSGTDSATIMSADNGNGFGFYSVAPNLLLQVPARSPIGTYTATITETLS